MLLLQLFSYEANFFVLIVDSVYWNISKKSVISTHSGCGEMADALVLGTSNASCGGSSPSIRI